MPSAAAAACGNGIGRYNDAAVRGALSVFAFSHGARRGCHLLFGTPLRDALIED